MKLYKLVPTVGILTGAYFGIRETQKFNKLYDEHEECVSKIDQITERLFNSKPPLFLTNKEKEIISAGIKVYNENKNIKFLEYLFFKTVFSEKYEKMINSPQLKELSQNEDKILQNTSTSDDDNLDPIKDELKQIIDEVRNSEEMTLDEKADFFGSTMMPDVWNDRYQIQKCISGDFETCKQNVKRSLIHAEQMHSFIQGYTNQLKSVEQIDKFQSVKQKELIETFDDYKNEHLNLIITEAVKTGKLLNDCALNNKECTQQDYSEIYQALESTQQSINSLNEAIDLDHSRLMIQGQRLKAKGKDINERVKRGENISLALIEYNLFAVYRGMGNEYSLATVKGLAVNLNNVILSYKTALEAKTK